MNENNTFLNRGNKIKETYKEIENETTNEVLATNFPAWDLLPPDSLIVRRKVKKNER